MKSENEHRERIAKKVIRRQLEKEKTGKKRSERDLWESDQVEKLRKERRVEEKKKNRKAHIQKLRKSKGC